MQRILFIALGTGIVGFVVGSGIGLFGHASANSFAEGVVSQFSKNATLASTEDYEASARQATVAALRNQIAQTEVERILEGVKFTDDHPGIIALEEQQAQLEKRLMQFQPDGDQKLVTVAIARAVESKIADLEVQYAKDQVQFTKEHPTLRIQASQLQALYQRLAILQ